MKQNTNTPAKKSTKSTSSKKQATATKRSNVALESNVPTADTIALNDFKNSLLVISLLVNLFVFIAWLALQVTTQYDVQVATFLFVR